MKIVLLALYDYHSMGIRGLHSLLKANGYDVKSFYFNYSTYYDGFYTEKELKFVVEWLKAENPAFIGIGVKSPLFPLFVQLSDLIYHQLPECKIIVGGSHPTATPESCLNYADYVVTGEGEYAIQDIIKDNCEKGVIRGKPVEDLNSLPFVYYGDDEFFYGFQRKIETISYNTTRGCWFDCSYCQENLNKSSVRKKSVERVIVDINKLRGLFPFLKAVTFSDSIFNHNNEWLEKFCHAFAGEELFFWCSIFAPFMTKEKLLLLKRAGFKSMRTGVQSASPYIRKEIFNRKDSLDDILKVAWDAHDLGIAINYDFIVENPYDTPQTLKETRDFIKELPPTAMISKYELRYWPGTALTKRVLKDKLIDKNDVAGNFVRLGGWSYTYQRA